MRAVALADLAAVFVVGHVTHVVEAVFDLPVCAVEIEQSLRGSLCLVGTRDAETDVGRGGSALDEIAIKVRGDSLDPKDLLGMGKIDESVERGAGPQPPNLDAAMRLVGRLNLRGEKPPGGGRRCPREAWAGCL